MNGYTHLPKELSHSQIQSSTGICVLHLIDVVNYTRFALHTHTAFIVMCPEVRVPHSTTDF